MTSLPVFDDDSDARISHNITVLMAYAGIRHMKDLSLRLRIPPATMSRRMNGQQPWLLHEVIRVAAYFQVSLDELAGEVPSLREWTGRRLEITDPLDLRACRDSNPKPSDLWLRSAWVLAW